jgi:hypothetical protein
MNFLQTWITGYYNPPKLAAELSVKKAPQWGFYATGLRGLMTSLFLYLPLFLMGNTPTTPSWLTFIPDSNYFLISIFFVPVFFYLLWLFIAALLYLVIRLSGLKTDIDQILNITGFNSLVTGTFILLWDWIWIIMGWHNPIFLGTSHLIIDIWFIIITSFCFIRILNLKPLMAILLNLLIIITSVPLAMIFMRAPI